MSESAEIARFSASRVGLSRKLADVRVPIAAALACAAAIALINLVPGADPQLEGVVFHFYLLSFVSFVAFVVSVLMVVVLGTRGFSVFSLVMAFASMGAYFTVHGFTTPGILTTVYQHSHEVSAYLSLLFGGVFLSLSTLTPRERLYAVLDNRKVAIAVASSVFFAGFLTLVLAFPEIFSHLVASAPGFERIVLYLSLAFYAAGLSHMLTVRPPERSATDRAVTYDLILLAAAQICQTFPTWSLSWWLYYGFVGIAFVVTVIMLMRRYEELRTFRAAGYYLAAGSVLTVFLALVGGEIVVELAGRASAAPVQVIRLQAVGIVGLIVGLSFLLLLVIVRRAGRIIAVRTALLESANEELRRSEAIRENLTNMIVHDLQNPLTAILGDLQLVELEIGKSHQAEAYVERASRSSRTLTRMIGNILSVNKMEAGRFELHRQPESMTRLVEAAVDEFQAAAEERRIEMARDYGADQIAEIDADLITRVLENLLTNAFKHSGDGSRITVSVRAEDPFVRVSVCDQGPGIPVTHRKMIFEKFSMLDDGKRRDGTGLGLAFCKMAIELHGGAIDVDDAPDGGSRFTFRLPAAVG